MVDSSEFTAWVALSLIKHVGGKTLRGLLAHFHQDVNAILCAETAELRQVSGVGAKIAESIRAIDLERIDKSIQAWKSAGVQIITMRDITYPARLRALDDAPPTLFILSNEPFRLPPRLIAIVGTRQPSQAAIDFTHELSFALCDQRMGIVSGLALGIDTAAHVGVLANHKGWAVAVLGCGVLNLYPPENHDYSISIRSRGCLICEVAPNATVSASGLVSRNRIITGLCDAVVIVETTIDGGAMHAARFAKQQDRPLFVRESGMSGNRALLEQGAHVIQSANDVLDKIATDSLFG